MQFQGPSMNNFGIFGVENEVSPYRVHEGTQEFKRKLMTWITERDLLTLRNNIEQQQILQESQSYSKIFPGGETGRRLFYQSLIGEVMQKSSSLRVGLVQFFLLRSTITGTHSGRKDGCKYISFLGELPVHLDFWVWVYMNHFLGYIFQCLLWKAK